MIEGYFEQMTRNIDDLRDEFLGSDSASRKNRTAPGSLVEQDQVFLDTFLKDMDNGDAYQKSMEQALKMTGGSLQKWR